MLVHFATSKETGIKGNHLGSAFFIFRHYFINKLLTEFCGEEASDPNVRPLCCGYLQTLMEYHDNLHVDEQKGKKKKEKEEVEVEKDSEEEEEENVTSKRQSKKRKVAKHEEKVRSVRRSTRKKESEEEEEEEEESDNSAKKVELSPSEAKILQYIRLKGLHE